VTRRTFLAGAGAAISQGVRASEMETGAPVCPKSPPPARTIAAFRSADLTSWSGDLRLALTCLEGLANRTAPRLYLIHDRYDELWLDWLRERGDIDRIEWLEIGEVFERFLPAATQMFVTDPAVPASINVATMLAAVHDGIAVTPAIANQFPLPFGATPDSSRTGMDLREFHWKKDLDAYRWAFAQLSPRLSKAAIAILAPEEVALRDYLVEFRIPILWISGPQDEARNPKAASNEEFEFAREILMRWPPNIPCFGWPTSGDKTGGIGETPGVRLASACAKYTACTAFDAYSPTVGNLSVHSGTRATLRQPHAAARLDRGKVHLAFIRSDGDGWNFHRHYYRKLFDDPHHGSVPMGWQVSPTASDGMPDILDYYYRHARPADCFVNALTGLGYIHEDNYAENYPAERQAAIWNAYLERSAAYRRRIDATVMNTYSEMRPARLESIAAKTGCAAIFANYGRSHITTDENTITVAGGVPVFRAVNRSPGPFTFTPAARRDAEAFMIAEIRRRTPVRRPAFLNVFLANWLTSLDMVENIVRALGPEYSVVRADQMAALWREAAA
jgi:GxGYxYP putative glycoside hydrolase C-terminal domain/GxGYxYP third domain/GxGYxYP_N second domain/GxGYxYP_N 1st domain